MQCIHIAWKMHSTAMSNGNLYIIQQKFIGDFPLVISWLLLLLVFYDYQVCVTTPSGSMFIAHTNAIHLLSKYLNVQLKLCLFHSCHPPFFHLLFVQTQFKYYFYRINRYKYVADAFCLFCKSKWIVWLQKYHSFSLSQFVLFGDGFHFNDIIFALIQDLFNWLLLNRQSTFW